MTSHDHPLDVDLEVLTATEDCECATTPAEWDRGWDTEHKGEMRPVLYQDFIGCPTHGDVGHDRSHGRCTICKGSGRVPSKLWLPWTPTTCETCGGDGGGTEDDGEPNPWVNCRDTMSRERRYERQIVVRVSDELFEALEADAEANGRTLAQTVRFRLRGLFVQSTESEPEIPDRPSNAGWQGNR
jgi:hypothetical protein